MPAGAHQHEAADGLRSLWARVFESPDDLQLRSVLADGLLQAGDARGEFIALQLVPDSKRTAEQRRRELQLMAELGVKLALPIPGLRRTLCFTGGLPSGVELRLGDAGVDGPELAVLERVVVSGMTGAGRMLSSATWRSLQRLEGVPGPALEQLVQAQTPRLFSLSLDQPPSAHEAMLAASVKGVVEFGWRDKWGVTLVPESLAPLRGLESLVIDVDCPKSSAPNARWRSGRILAKVHVRDVLQSVQEIDAAACANDGARSAFRLDPNESRQAIKGLRSWHRREQMKRDPRADDAMFTIHFSPHEPRVSVCARPGRPICGRCSRGPVFLECGVEAVMCGIPCSVTLACRNRDELHCREDDLAKNHGIHVST